MTKSALPVLFFCALGCNLLAQQNPEPSAKWYLKPAGGLYLPITKLLTGEITDNLVNYNDYSYYWQILSANFFLNKHFGVELTIQGSTANQISTIESDFNNEINSLYSSAYYINSSYDFYDKSNALTGSIGRFYLGAVYRIEKDKLLLMPKILFGVTSFDSNNETVYLKEKNTNITFAISYKQNQDSPDHVTIGAGITTGYKLTKRLYMNLDLNYVHYKSGIVFEEEMINLYTQEIVKQHQYNYTKHINSISVGVGLIIALKFKKHKVNND